MSNNGANGKDRIAKAKATRDRKRGEMRDNLLASVSKSEIAQLDWQYAYNPNGTSALPLAAVRLAFGEDPRFVPLMRTGKIGVPARSLKYPKWADVLTEDERKNLPRISIEDKVRRDLLPLSETGHEIFDADISSLEDRAIDAARRETPRRARAAIEEQQVIFSRLIDNHAETVDDAHQAKENNRVLVADRARLEGELRRKQRELTAAEQKLARLEGTAPLQSSGQTEEARPH